MVPGLSIVVVNYRTAGDLALFLRSLDEHSPPPPWTATVVNVCPRDEDLKVAGQWVEAHPGCGQETHADNVGYGRAANRARLGPYDTVAVFNADVTLRAGALQACAQALRDHPGWGVVGPRQVDQAGAITHGGIFGTPERPHHRGWQHSATVEPTDVRDDCISVSGSAYFVSADVWNELTDCPRFQEVAPGEAGPFLPTKLFYEEMWVSRHAAAHGHRIAFLGTTTIEHRWHSSVRANGVHTAPLMEQSLALYRQACDHHGMAHE